jgi:hypothetical protein
MSGECIDLFSPVAFFVFIFLILRNEKEGDRANESS